MRVDSSSATAFLKTYVAASFAAVAWLMVAWFNEKKPKFLGVLTGAVAGSGYGDSLCRLRSPDHGGHHRLAFWRCVLLRRRAEEQAAVGRRARRVGRSRCRRLPRHHHVGHFRPTKPSILTVSTDCFYGDPTFLLKQVTGVVFSPVWAFIFTYAMLRTNQRLHYGESQ